MTSLLIRLSFAFVVSIGMSVFLRSGLPFLIMLLATLIELAAATRPTQQQNKQHARTVKLPRALCMACNRTVATTERDGVQRYRVHRVTSSKDAEMCPQSRKIVGDEVPVIRAVVIPESAPPPKPKPNFRSHDGITPEAEPTADEQFGTRSKFPSLPTCYFEINGKRCGMTAQMHTDNAMSHSFMDAEEYRQLAAGGE